VSSNSIHKYLGVVKHRFGVTEEADRIGLTTGLRGRMWSELLQTEVAIMPGKGKLVLTGKLGEVMQESAQAALSYVRSRGRM